MALPLPPRKRGSHLRAGGLGHAPDWRGRDPGLRGRLRGVARESASGSPDRQRLGGGAEIPLLLHDVGAGRDDLPRLREGRHLRRSCARRSKGEEDLQHVSSGRCRGRLLRWRRVAVLSQLFTYAYSERADERTRTAYPCSLRVIGHVLQGVAQACKSRISKGVSFPCLAECCTVLRSRWYQSGINATLHPCDSRSSTKARARNILRSKRLLNTFEGRVLCKVRVNNNCLSRPVAREDRRASALVGTRPDHERIVLLPRLGLLPRPPTYAGPERPCSSSSPPVPPYRSPQPPRPGGRSPR